MGIVRRAKNIPQSCSRTHSQVASPIAMPRASRSRSPIIRTKRISSIRIDIEYSLAVNCEPPDGAWFPALDEVACAIIGFGNFVWKGIQLVGSGISFIILTLAGVIVFVGGIVVNLILGTLAVYATLFALGAPTPVQEIIDVLVIVSGAYLVFAVVSLMRGTEG